MGRVLLFIPDILNIGKVFVVEMAAATSLYLGFGTAWMLAGRHFWKRRYRRGLITLGIGILAVVVCIVVVFLCWRIANPGANQLI